MANDLTRESDRLLDEGRALVRDNQSGGRHRRSGKAIGEGSARMRKSHFTSRLVQAAMAIVGILIAAGVIGLIIDGIGFVGVMVTALAIMCALVLVSSRRIKPPQRADLNKGDVKQLVARTELWLEHQRPALPAPAVKIVEDIGVQLDALGLQLETVDQAHPAAVETRKLVGEHLPEMIDSYKRIPAHLRREERAGAKPDDQLVDSLGKISREIDSVTRQLAEGSLDDLAIRTRFLEYRYGDAEGLPPPDKD